MLICPECRKGPLPPDQECKSCGWTPSVGPISAVLSSRDMTHADVQEYTKIYEKLFARNLAAPIEADRYIENLAKNFIKKLPSLKGKAICDVGAGRGYFVKHALAENPTSITAIDIVPESVARIQANYGVRSIVANAENIPFENEFDLISASDIVEHIINVSDFFVSANIALKENGHLAVRVPYREDMVQYSTYYGLPVSYSHLRYFRGTELREVIEQFGFKVESIHYDGFRPAYLQPAWERMGLTRVLQKQLLQKFGSHDDVTLINPHVGRLLMKPIEISIVARKIKTMVPINLY